MKVKRAVIAVCSIAYLAIAGSVQAADKEPSFVVELGGVGEWGLQGGNPGYGPHAGLEFTIIEHWLEVEVAFSPLFSKTGVEYESELIFKKPFELSKNVEFLIGAGPEWIHRDNGEVPIDLVVVEATAGFVFALPQPNTGVFIEGAYAYDFGTKEDAVRVTTGLHIGVP